MSMTATFISMFRQPIESFMDASLMRRAHDKKIIQSKVISILESVKNNHHKVDDTPYGGGPGELMKIDIIAPIIKTALRQHPEVTRAKKRVILLDPSGPQFTQKQAARLSAYEELIFVCGRYEGIDARIYHYCDEAISVGDFVLSNGDLAAITVFDATARLIPGFLGNSASPKLESFSYGRLEASQYTRPKIYDNQSVPDILQQGNHEKIQEERTFESLIKTLKIRPDLFDRFPCSEKESAMLKNSKLPEKKYPWQSHHE